MKRTIAVLLLFVMCLSLAACSKKPISAAVFEEKAKEKGAGIARDYVDDSHAYKAQIKESVYAKIDGWEAVFYEVSNKETAKKMYNEYVAYLDDSNKSSKSENRKSGTNFSRFTLNAGGSFYLVAYVDNTYLMIRGSEKDKDAIKSFANQLGYK